MTKMKKMIFEVWWYRTGTENKTSSENERHITYAGTDSMYDDPKKKYNRVVDRKMIWGYTNLHMTHRN